LTRFDLPAGFYIFHHNQWRQFYYNSRASSCKLFIVVFPSVKNMRGVL
jgi:hypothetical protein